MPLDEIWFPMISEGSENEEKRPMFVPHHFDYFNWDLWMRAAIHFIRTDGETEGYGGEVVEDAVQSVIERARRLTQGILPGPVLQLEDSNSVLHNDRAARYYLFGKQELSPGLGVLMALRDRVYRPFLPTSDTVAMRIRKLTANLQRRIPGGGTVDDADDDSPWNVAMLAFFDLLNTLFPDDRTHMGLDLGRGVCAAVDAVLQRLLSVVSHHPKHFDTANFVWFSLIHVRMRMCHPPRRLDPITGENAVAGIYVPFELAKAIRLSQHKKKTPLHAWTFREDRFGWTIDPSRPDRVLGVSLQDTDTFPFTDTWHTNSTTEQTEPLRTT